MLIKRKVYALPVRGAFQRTPAIFHPYNLRNNKSQSYDLAIPGHHYVAKWYEILEAPKTWATI